MDKQKYAVWKIDKPFYSLSFMQDFASGDIDDYKQAGFLPHYNGRPQTLAHVTEDNQTCIFMQTEGQKQKRHGIVIAENIPVEPNMTVELKIKPIGDLEGVAEFWLFGADNAKWVNFKLFGGYYGMKRETVANFDGEAVYLPIKLWDWGNWYYLHIQLGTDKTVMALLDENRNIITRHSFRQPISSLFNSFTIAISQELNMENTRSSDMKAFMTDVKYGVCIGGMQDLMSMPTKNDLAIDEVKEKLENITTMHNEKDRFDNLASIWKEYNEKEPKIGFFLRPLIKEYSEFYGQSGELIDIVDKKEDTFQYFKVITEFANHSPKELTEALNRFSSYNILKSEFYKEYCDDVNMVVFSIFDKLLADHFFKKLFAKNAIYPYTVYKEALFGNNAAKHAEPNVDWQTEYYNAAFHKKTKIKVIGAILDVIIAQMINIYGYPQPISRSQIYKKYEKVVSYEVNKFCLVNNRANWFITEKQQLLMRSIKIDVLKLDNIRASADHIQERLIAEDELPVNDIATGQKQKPLENRPEEAKNKQLPEIQTRLLKTILNHDIAAMKAIIKENGLMISVVIDEINNKLFDRFNDNCIELNDDVPIIVEDYYESLKGILNQ